VICDDGGVPHPLRRLLLALVLACSGVVWTQVPAQACTCQIPSVSRAASQADVVFSGVLLGEDRGNRQARLALEVDRVYKGDPGATPVEVASPTDSCGLRLTEGQAYVVFAVSGRTDLTSERCDGTARARGSVLTAVERALGPGERFEEPPLEPAKPTYTRVLDAEPPEFTRLAAPGAALVLVGLLGWLLVRRWS
jgi:hypothetical protein